MFGSRWGGIVAVLGVAGVSAGLLWFVEVTAERPAAEAAAVCPGPAGLASVDFIFQAKTLSVPSEQIGKAFVGDDPGGANALNLELCPEAAAQLAAATGEAVGQQARIVIAGRQLAEPFILAPILDGRLVVSGEFRRAELDPLIAAIRGSASGATGE